MNAENTLSFCRLYHLMANDIRLNKKMILTIAATILVFLALMPFHATENSATYVFMLYLGGFILSSRAFSELHDPRRAALFFMLPCSNLERFLSKWLLTSIIYALALLVLYYLCSVLSVFINTLFLQKQVSLLSLMDTSLWLSVGKYIVLQSIFLLGAIVFKKYAFIKTLLTLGCVFLIVSIFFGMFTWGACNDCTFKWWMVHNTVWIFLMVAMPFCWIVSYLKLTEFELK